MSKPIFQRGPVAPETRVIKVTPDMARKWLDLNVQNRTISKTRVEQYARDMREGRWYLTHQGIAFDSDGALRDGQHRLQAIIVADVPVEMMVTAGLPAESQAHIDTGRARTPSDMLSVLDGYKNATSIAAIAKLAIAWDEGFRWLNNYKATHQEIRDYVKAPENHLVIRAADVGAHARKYVPMKPSLLGLTYYVAARIDRPDADVFFVEQLTEQIGLHPGDPAKTLHKRLVQDSEKQGMSADFSKVAYVITAWNKFRTGEKISKLQAPAGRGWTMNNYPEPK